MSINRMPRGLAVIVVLVLLSGLVPTTMARHAMLTASSPVAWSIGRLWIDHHRHLGTAFIVASVRQEGDPESGYRLLVLSAGHNLSDDLQLDLHAIDEPTGDGDHLTLPAQTVPVYTCRVGPA
jgi:hypothetical protein